MSDYATYDNPDSSTNNGSFSRFSRNSPYVRAALIFAVPFIIVDFFNYYTAGTASIISFPILLLLYTACGLLGAKLSHDKGYREYFLAGALSGGILWLTSTIVNVIVAMIVGTFSLFTTLVLGIPYLCLCAPLQVIAGAIGGGIGGLVFGYFFGD